MITSTRTARACGYLRKILILLSICGERAGNEKATKCRGLLHSRRAAAEAEKHLEWVSSCVFNENLSFEQRFRAVEFVANRAFGRVIQPAEMRADDLEHEPRRVLVRWMPPDPADRSQAHPEDARTAKVMEHRVEADDEDAF